MTANGGYYGIVGYGGKIDMPTIDMITSEKTIVGNLVGTYPELIEFMALADRGLVNLHTKEYKLSRPTTHCTTCTTAASMAAPS
jgi:NAD+-dependent secondary alcohol dehydrogenase Adh1